jgi:hypothetical protein
MRFVVVKNHGRSVDFSQFDESPVVARLKEAGGLVLDLPLLHAATMYKIDKKGSSFWAAMNSLDDTLALLPMEKQRTKLWLRESYQAVEQAFA